MRTTASARRGFGIAPVLYLLLLIGVTSGALFSNYSQIVGSNIAITNTMTVINDLDAASATLAAVSRLSNDGLILCPPNLHGASDVGSNPQDCPTSTPVMLQEIPASTDARVPRFESGSDLQSYLISAGSPQGVGIFSPAAGVKQLDPWGRYYVVCRWNNSPGSSNPAFQVISGGPSGTIRTRCGEAAAQGNHSALMNAAAAVNRASVWQVTSSGATTEARYSATGVSVDSDGNLTVPGNLNLTGGLGTTVTIPNADLVLTNGNLTLTNGSIFANNGTFGGTLSAASASLSGSLSATSGTFSGGALAVGAGGPFSVDADGNITTTGTASLGTTTVGALTASTVTAGTTTVGALSASSGTFTGDITANSVSAETITGTNVSADSLASGAISASGDGAVGGTLTVNNLVVTGTATGNIAGSGDVDLGTAVGQIALGTQVTGTLAIAHGGTGATTAATALNNLFGAAGAGTTLPEARLPVLYGTAPAGTYNQVSVDQYGRVYEVSNVILSGDSISDDSGNSVSVSPNTIKFTIQNVDKGSWGSTGFTVGSTAAARASIDAGYATDAIIAPVGTSGVRPTTPYVGMIRYNSTLNVFEGYQGNPPAWVPIASASGAGGSAGSFDGVCGSANGQSALTSAPNTANMCASGVIGPLSGTGNPGWTWSCMGIGSGITSNCAATAAVINATCGTHHEQVLSAIPTNLCAAGTMLNFSEAPSLWTWSCYGGGRRNKQNMPGL